MGILYDWWPCETWRCCVNKRCSTPSINRHGQQHVKIFIRYVQGHVHSEPGMHARTHTVYSTCTVYTQEPSGLYTARCTTHTFSSPARSYCSAQLCSSFTASVLLLPWENITVRNKSCPTEHERIEFSTCCLLLWLQQWGTSTPLQHWVSYEN